MVDHEGTDATDPAEQYGFEPAVSVTGGEAATPAAAAGSSSSKPKRRRRLSAALRRKVGATAILVITLGLVGGTYAIFASSSGAADSAATQASINEGRQLFNVSCITCHGQNLQGVREQGPSLVGVGGAAVYFQVSTGRMPLTAQGANANRKKPKFTEEQTEALANYVQSVGGGPSIPTGSLKLSTAEIGMGGELFRLNCASCHGATGKGAPLSAGKTVPSLNDATPKQIYGAMISGPEQMPPFSNNQLTVHEKKAIITYIETLKASDDPGGSGIDRIGPVSEAIVAWVAGIGALMIVILWIGARNQ